MAWDSGTDSRALYLERYVENPGRSIWCKLHDRVMFVCKLILLTWVSFAGIIPAALGNIFGGALFCGGYYYWMFIFQQPETSIDGAYYHHQTQQQQLEEGRLHVGIGAYQSGGITHAGQHEGIGGPETSRDTSHELKEEDRQH